MAQRRLRPKIPRIGPYTFSWIDRAVWEWNNSWPPGFPVPHEGSIVVRESRVTSTPKTKYVDPAWYGPVREWIDIDRQGILDSLNRYAALNQLPVKHLQFFLFAN